MPIAPRLVVPLLVALLAAGCTGAPRIGEPVALSTYLLDGIEFPVSASWQTDNASGIAVFSIRGGAQNASVYYTSSYTWDRTRLNPLAVIFLDAAGRVDTAPFVSEYPPAPSRDDFLAGHVALGPVEVSTPPQEPAMETSEGAYLFRTEARESTLVIVWAGLAGPATFTFRLLAGSTLDLVHQGGEVAAVDAAQMRGGPARARSHFASLTAGDAFTFGSADQDVLAVVKTAPVYGMGSLTVEADSTRVFPLARHEEPSPKRYVYTTTGEVRATLDAAGVENLRAVLVLAAIPKGALPTLWYEVDEPY